MSQVSSQLSSVPTDTSAISNTSTASNPPSSPLLTGIRLPSTPPSLGTPASNHRHPAVRTRSYTTPRSTTARHPTRPPGRGRVRQRPYESTVHLWHRHRLSLKEFLRVWVAQGTKNVRILHKALQCSQIQSSLARVDHRQDTSSRHLYTLDASLILPELDALIGGPFFNKFTQSTQLEDVDFTTAFQLIQEKAPKWYTFLCTILANRRSTWNSYAIKDNTPNPIIFFVTAMVCRSRAAHTATFFPKLLGIYLLNSGVKRRVLDSLAGLGIVDSYKILNQLNTQLASHERIQLKDVARNPQTVVVFDNFDFLDRVRDQVIGSSENRMRNMTNALLVSCPHILASGLTQDMHRPERPLSYINFTRRALGGRDQQARDSTIYLMYEALRFVHKSALDSVFANCHNIEPVMPVVQQLPHCKRYQVHHLGAIFENEGTVDGTYAVHADIWLKKLKFPFSQPAGNTPSSHVLAGRHGYTTRSQAHNTHVEPVGSAAITDDAFSHRLWLSWGDQKTAQLARTVKLEQRFAHQDFDRRQWLLVPPALFHVLQALVYTLVRTHWEAPPGSYSNCTLLSDISYWNRSGFVRESLKYHLMEPLLRQGWYARVTALFYTGIAAAAEHTNLADSDSRNWTTVEQFDNAIQKLRPEQVLSILQQIQHTVFSLSSWSGTDQPDKEYVSMCRYMQEVEIFLALRHAIKHGDTGWIRRIIPRLASLFYGAEQYNYGHEMLFFSWLLTDEVSDLALQEAILSSSVVNESGRPGCFKPIDLVIEHANCSLAIDMKSRKNATHDVMQIFDQVALTSSSSSSIRHLIEGQFGTVPNPAHSFKDATRDVFSRAIYLYKESMVRPRPPTLLGQVQFESPNIMLDGSEQLELKIQAFNSHVVHLNTFASADDTLPNDTLPDDSQSVDTAMLAEAAAVNIATLDLSDLMNSISTD